MQLSAKFQTKIKTEERQEPSSSKKDQYPMLLKSEPGQPSGSLPMGSSGKPPIMRTTLGISTGSIAAERRFESYSEPFAIMLSLPLARRTSLPLSERTMAAPM